LTCRYCPSGSPLTRHSSKTPTPPFSRPPRLTYPLYFSQAMPQFSWVPSSGREISEKNARVPFLRCAENANPLLGAPPLAGWVSGETHVGPKLMLLLRPIAVFIASEDEASRLTASRRRGGLIKHCFRQAVKFRHLWIVQSQLCQMGTERIKIFEIRPVMSLRASDDCGRLGQR